MKTKTIEALVKQFNLIGDKRANVIVEGLDQFGNNITEELFIKGTKMNDGFFPRCTDEDKRAGWDIDTKLLHKISLTTNEMIPDFSVNMEGVELVLLSLEQLGWKVEPPNERS